ncbi:MAG: peptide ABC transporter substrate-binding protein [Chloroflexota bacterium]
MRRSGGRPHRRSSARRLSTLIAALLLASTGLAGGAGPGPGTTGVAAAGKDEVSILSGDVASLDPALQGDIASAQVGAQLFEALTAIDPSLNVRPALAESWDVLDGGRRVVFHLRPGQAFSDGSPLGAKDVVRSWLRIVDPKQPSPLASLMADVEGALDYLRGKTSDPSSVGIRADGTTVEVRLDRPAADFPSIVSSATFAVVPPGVGSKAGALEPGESFVASGAYVLSAKTATEMTLTANDRYWAGPPPIKTVHLLTTLKGKSPVQAFEDGELDYTPIGDYDAAWIRYDATLGRSLRSVPSAAVSYYGFDASRPPFNDVKVRQAFAWAVDWKRLVTLAGGDSEIPATSLIPPGIPGRSERDFSPKHDPEAARAALAAAGYPGGAGFPEVTLVDSGAGYDEAILAELKRELGITVRYEGMESTPYFLRLAVDPPAFWALAWVADYPGPNDFLGLLLSTGSSTDYGRWSSAEFDAAIAQAGAATDPAAIRAAFDAAELIVQRDVPVVPVSYGAGYALARDGLLGATETGLGILRLAGLAWSNQ